MDNPHDTAAAVERHANAILQASGSNLKNYTMARTRQAILSAVMDCYDDAYRAGSAATLAKIAKVGK